MGKNWPSLDPVEDELVREVMRVHEEAYGRPATNLQVGIEETFVAVVMDVTLTPAEEEMVQGGHRSAVRKTREEFSHAIRPVYEALVERATGRRVEAFISRVALEPERPWGTEVFLLAPPADSSQAEMLFAD
ncbi:MAG TPA: Na-translocating system protein MpsC family protein [Solirubrobacterales bacterium]